MFFMILTLDKPCEVIWMKITSKNNIPRLYLMGNQYHIAHLEADNRSGNFSQKDLDGVPKLNLYTLTSDDVLTTR